MMLFDDMVLSIAGVLGLQLSEVLWVLEYHT